jgi:hypothetical protein
LSENKKSQKAIFYFETQPSFESEPNKKRKNNLKIIFLFITSTMNLEEEENQPQDQKKYVLKEERYNLPCPELLQPRIFFLQNSMSLKEEKRKRQSLNSSHQLSSLFFFFRIINFLKETLSNLRAEQVSNDDVECFVLTLKKHGANLTNGEFARM